MQVDATIAASGTNAGVIVTSNARADSLRIAAIRIAISATVAASAASVSDAKNSCICNGVTIA